VPSRRLLSPEMLRDPGSACGSRIDGDPAHGKSLTEESARENNGGATGVQDDDQLWMIIEVLWNEGKKRTGKMSF